jgi:crossover junction endodeoxyribonuclease RusA
MTTQQFILPFPPSVNTYYRHIPRRGGVLISAKGRDYRKQVGILCALALDSFTSSEPFVGRLSITIELIPPDKRKRDVDNYLKSLLDALTHAKVWHDDSQIYELIVRKKEPSVTEHCVFVTVSTLEECQTNNTKQ